MKGMTQISANTASSVIAMMLKTRSDLEITMTVTSVARHAADVGDGDHQNDRGDDPGDGRAISRLAVLAGLEIHPGAQHVGGAAGAAIGHGVDEVENAEAVDHRQGQHDDMGLLEARQGDVAEGLPARGTVNARRLVLLPWNGLQPGEIEHHREADMAPDIG